MSEAKQDWEVARERVLAAHSDAFESRSSRIWKSKEDFILAGAGGESLEENFLGFNWLDAASRLPAQAAPAVSSGETDAATLRCCGVFLRFPNGGYECTLPISHAGQHVANGIDNRELFRWPSDTSGGKSEEPSLEQVKRPTSFSVWGFGDCYTKANADALLDAQDARIAELTRERVAAISQVSATARTLGYAETENARLRARIAELEQENTALRENLSSLCDRDHFTGGPQAEQKSTRWHQAMDDARKLLASHPTPAMGAESQGVTGDQVEPPQGARQTFEGWVDRFEDDETCAWRAPLCDEDKRQLRCAWNAALASRPLALPDAVHDVLLHVVALNKSGDMSEVSEGIREIAPKAFRLLRASLEPERPANPNQRWAGSDYEVSSPNPEQDGGSK